MIPYGILRNVSTVYTPYLDHEVFDLLSSLPPVIFEDHAFHDDAIARAYPEFADLPYAVPKKDDRAFLKDVHDSLPSMLRLDTIATARYSRSCTICIASARRHRAVWFANRFSGSRIFFISWHWRRFLMHP